MKKSLYSVSNDIHDQIYRPIGSCSKEGYSKQWYLDVNRYLIKFFKS